MKTVRAIIFDCFGVLVTDALEAIIHELGLSTEERTTIIQLVTSYNRGEITPETYRKTIADKLGITVDEYINKIRNGEVKNRQLMDYIQILKPNYRIGLLSNVGSIESLHSRFSKEELETFDVSVASGEIGYAKPEAQAYEITASKLSVLLNECIMVDDREDYCEGATGVGMQAIEYTSFEQFKDELSILLGGNQVSNK